MRHIFVLSFLCFEEASGNINGHYETYYAQRVDRHCGDEKRQNQFIDPFEFILTVDLHLLGALNILSGQYIRLLFQSCEI